MPVREKFFKNSQKFRGREILIKTERPLSLPKSLKAGRIFGKVLLSNVVITHVVTHTPRQTPTSSETEIWGVSHLVWPSRDTHTDLPPKTLVFASNQTECFNTTGIITAYIMLIICINITTLSFFQVQYESPKQLSSLKIRCFKPSRGVVSILFHLSDYLLRPN